MDGQDYELLSQGFFGRLREVDTTYHRYLFSQINWDNRLIGIKGAAGVGKTTLLLQHIKEDLVDVRHVLYVSLDNLWFKSHDLIELVRYFYSHDGEVLFLDEIHRLRDWSTYLKNIYDDFPRLKVVYTGSSMLDISRHEADLSRRQRMYTLGCLSFREYLCFEGYNVDPVSIEELLENHVNIAMRVLPKGKHVLPLFEQYLEHGCYPFYKEEGDGFANRLQSVIHRIIEVDLPAVEDVTYATVQKMLKMLMILADRVPLIPKMSELYRELETTRDQGLAMLGWLEKGGLLGLLTREVRNLNTLNKPDKIYLDNPNLMHCLSAKPDEGTVRETFFYNQLHQAGEVLLPKNGDFLFEKKFVFEIGGKGKTFAQIKEEENGFVVADEIELGSGNRIPLWMFGLLY